MDTFAVSCLFTLQVQVGRSRECMNLLHHKARVVLDCNVSGEISTEANHFTVTQHKTHVFVSDRESKDTECLRGAKTQLPQVSSSLARGC